MGASEWITENQEIMILSQNQFTLTVFLLLLYQYHEIKTKQVAD